MHISPIFLLNPHHPNHLLPSYKPALGIKQTGAHVRSTAKRKVQQTEWRCEGHRYSVVIRNLDARQFDSGLIDSAMDNLSAEGFLNLFLDGI